MVSCDFGVRPLIVPPVCFVILPVRTDAFRAGIHAHRRDITPVNDAIRINHEQRRPFADAFILPIHAIESGNRSLRFKVGEEGEMQLAIPAERRMTHEPSTEMPMSSAPRFWNSGSISL